MRKKQTRKQNEFQERQPLVIGIAIIIYLIALFIAGQVKPAKAEAADSRYPMLEGAGLGTPAKHVRHHRKRSRVTIESSGNAVVRSHSGISVRVAPSARAALQCVVDAVEASGVKIKAMRGYGRGTVRASLHPSGRAIDINQTDRNVTEPNVPRAVANAAADQCGVTSGARWGYADNGHWNLAIHGRSTQEPWPRVVTK